MIQRHRAVHITTCRAMAAWMQAINEGRHTPAWFGWLIRTSEVCREFCAVGGRLFDGLSNGPPERAIDGAHGQLDERDAARRVGYCAGTRADLPFRATQRYRT